MTSGCSLSASAYALLSVSSANPLISPCRSMTATRGFLCRTYASSALVGIVFLLSRHNQFNGVAALIAANAQFIDQIADQEESPSARRLLLSQFCLKIGRL